MITINTAEGSKQKNINNLQELIAVYENQYKFLQIGRAHV
jgi:hypothetical protein